MTPNPNPADDLRRWADSGAVWRVLSRHGGTLVIGLYRCDGGEEVDRVTSSDPRLVEYVGIRDGSED